jgi:hypothetical protein
MKVFVGYGYNERDKWIEQMIFPIIQAFGDEVVHGRVLPGENLADAVKARIRQCDIVLGFATRRIDPATGQLGNFTHRWVTDELAIAFGRDAAPASLEIREKEGDAQQGIGGGKGYLEYDPAVRDRFLVDFVQNFAELRNRASRFELHLMPREFTDGVAPLLMDRNLECSYQLMDDTNYEETPPIPTRIVRIKGGLFICTNKVPRNSYIRVRVSRDPDFLWVSAYQKVDTRIVAMEPAKP